MIHDPTAYEYNSTLEYRRDLLKRQITLCKNNIHSLTVVIMLKQKLFPPNTIKVIPEFERIQKKICRHKMSIMFNEICINEEMLPKYIYIYIYICIYIYIYIYIYIKRELGIK